jgi:hypothetical protein
MTPEQIKVVWRSLVQVYGHKFADQYGPTPNEAWSAYLATLSVDAAKHAIRKLVFSGEPFAPTLPEFIAYAGQYRPPESQVVRPMRIEHQQPMTRELIRDGLDRLRQELGLPPRKTNGLEKL